MKHLLKTVLATSVLVAISGTASAADKTFEVKTFEVKFTFDRNAPVNVTYARLLETAKKPCRIQYRLFTTGYGNDVMRRFRKKCERMLIDQAINAIENPSLTALHKSNIGTRPTRTILVDAKPASKSYP